MTETQKLSLRTREYETIYILRPTTKPEDAERLAQRVADVVAREKGKITKVDNWGKRRLAYPIQRNSRGIFVHVKYLGEGKLVQELERNLRQFEEIVRFQSVLLGAGPEIETVSVNPEDVKFIAVEADESEEVLTREERLGLPTDRGGGHDRYRDHHREGEPPAFDAGETVTAEGDAPAAAASAPAVEGEES